MLCIKITLKKHVHSANGLSLSSSPCIWIKMHLDAERTRVKRKKREALKCNLARPWYPRQFIPPVCQHCHPSVTWRQWWSCLSFGSCGLLSEANQLLCMQCERPSLPCNRPVFILSRWSWLETISNGGVKPVVVVGRGGVNMNYSNCVSEQCWHLHMTMQSDQTRAAAKTGR